MNLMLGETLITQYYIVLTIKSFCLKNKAFKQASCL